MSIVSFEDEKLTFDNKIIPYKELFEANGYDVKTHIEKIRANKRESFSSISPLKPNFEEYNFIDHSFEGLKEKFISSKANILIGSHFGLYRNIYRFPNLVGRKFYITANPDILSLTKRFSKLSKFVKIVPNIGKTELAECKKGIASFILPMDVLLNFPPYAHLPMINKTLYFSIGWARLAFQLNANVFVLLSHKIDEEYYVRSKVVAAREFDDIYALAAHISNYIADIMKESMYDWEMLYYFLLSQNKFERSDRAKLYANYTDLGKFDRDLRQRIINLKSVLD